MKNLLLILASASALVLPSTAAVAQSKAEVSQALMDQTAVEVYLAVACPKVFPNAFYQAKTNDELDAEVDEVIWYISTATRTPGETLVEQLKQIVDEVHTEFVNSTPSQRYEYCYAASHRRDWLGRYQST